MLCDEDVQKRIQIGEHCFFTCGNFVKLLDELQVIFRAELTDTLMFHVIFAVEHGYVAIGVSNNKNEFIQSWEAIYNACNTPANKNI